MASARLHSAVENLYRPIHELRPAIAWTTSAFTTVAGGAATGMPIYATAAMSATSLAMAAVRWRQTKHLVDAKVALAGHQFWLMPVSEMRDEVSRRADRMWLGRGFRWTAQHTQRAKVMNGKGPEEMLPPDWVLKLFRKPTNYEDLKGDPWIHGLEPNERSIALPWDHSEGNWCIFGTTGAGKTRLYEVLCSQIVERGDVLVVIDPKYDKDLRSLLIRACKAAGRPEAFAEFHPAFPSRSVRLDPMANFNRPTEIASRIADVVGGGGPQDTFVSFIWRTVDSITGGLLYAGYKPSLARLRFYAESGPEPLVEICLQKFLSRWRPGTWEDMVNTLVEQIKKDKKLQPRLKTGTPRVQAMVEIYHQEVEDRLKEEALNGLISSAEHNREHYGKMVANLLPLLTQLTSGDLKGLLSPDYDDIEDQREILDMQKVIKGKRVLYVATDSLSDPTVGSAIAAILLSDLRAVAGARYNDESEEAAADKTKIHILCDEACETVTPPLISIMNKGRGAGMISYLATQNFSDYIAKFGSEDMARQVVGNGNNRLCLRVVDTKTQQYMVENFGLVDIQTVGTGVNSRTDSETGGMEFGGGTNASVSRTEVELFPGYLLGRLPDLHYVAAISGGRVYKGRIPKLTH